MIFDELNRDQIAEIKQSILCDRYDERGESPSWGELAAADEIISDAEARQEYGEVEFSPDDFCCSADVRCA